MQASGFYKYLGVETGWHGTRMTTTRLLERKLDNLRRAPLKPQQRLWIMKLYVLPSIYHQLVLGRTSKKFAGGAGHNHQTDSESDADLAQRRTHTHVLRKGRRGETGFTTASSDDPVDARGPGHTTDEGRRPSHPGDDQDEGLPKTCDQHGEG